MEITTPEARAAMLDTAEVLETLADADDGITVEQLRAVMLDFAASIREVVVEYERRCS